MEYRYDFPLNEILRDKIFWNKDARANTAGNYTASEIYNPAGSGVLVAILAFEVWMSVAGQVNVLLHNTHLGSGGGNKNSLYWPPAGPAASKAQGWYQEAGATAIAGWGSRVSQANQFYELERPWVLSEGYSFRLYPDTTAAYSAVFAFLWREISV